MVHDALLQVAPQATSVVPVAPTTIAETGISVNSLLRILLKAMYVRGIELGTELADDLKIGVNIVQDLLDEARNRKLLETRGSEGGSIKSEVRYGLTLKGQEWATEALELSQYIGPVPVSLPDFHTQVNKQPILGEHVEQSALVDGVSEFVVPASLVRRLGQALNSARTLLLYGAPGNGKTTLAEIIGELFEDAIFIPYCIEVDAKIIIIYDPALHVRVTDPATLLQKLPELADFKPRDIDQRWVVCKRPMVRAGGELTLEMLDLQFNPHSKFYEAPLHVKAIGGTFLIDDLGRQLVEPEALLNRWITPMDKRADYLSLDTGRTFVVPFDVFVIFATNLTPEDLMDPAFLRRIPYKVRVSRPSPEEYREVFRKLCVRFGLTYDDAAVSFVMDKIVNVLNQPLSFYQCEFIVDQILTACKYMGRAARFDVDLLVDALDNISLHEGMISFDDTELLSRNGNEDSSVRIAGPK
jgi:DNA-binding MarR family transcriptional regulator